MPIITVLTDAGMGGTFLDWTLHYLAGHQDYFLAKDGLRWKPVPQDPLTGINAHGFVANQPYDHEEFLQIWQDLCHEPTDEFHSLYFHDWDADRHHGTNNLAKAVDLITNAGMPLIYLGLDPKHALYRCRYAERVLRPKMCDYNAINRSFDEQHMDFVTTFFARDLEHWKNLGLSDAWDRREFLALNVNPMNISKITDFLSMPMDHVYIEAVDLYTNFDFTVYTLFEQLGIDIDHTRFEPWQKIYNRWKKIHHKYLRFMWYHDIIVDNTIKDVDMDLLQFDLDIMQEAAIQRALIHNHNLNLKTWQLEKFTNTRQLHRLLESNQHSLAI